MRKKIDIGFLGYGTRALDALMEHKDFNVRYFFAPKARLCDDVYNARDMYGDRLTYTVVENNAQLLSLVSECKDVSCFLINACPIILKQNVLSQKPFFNIHPGSLHTNRGHQPHMWTVLLGEEKSTITLHCVTEGIDEGKVIRSKELDIPSGSDAGQVLNLLEDEIPFLLDGLYDYLTGASDGEDEIYGGTYRRIMTHDDYRINLSELSKPGFIDDCLRKIRARSLNHGAFFDLGSDRIYVDRGPEISGSLDTCIPPVLHSIDGDLIRLSSGDCRLTFHINHIEGVPDNPVPGDTT